MPTPIIDIECHREYIKSLFQEDNIKKQEICDILLQKFRIHISLRTLESWLKQWGIAKNRLSEDTPELRLRLTVLFFDVGLEDKDILHVLQHEHYQIELRKLQTIRKDMGLFRRGSVFNKEESDMVLEQLVQKELDKGEILTFGRGLLYEYFRSKGHIIGR